MPQLHAMTQVRMRTVSAWRSGAHLAGGLGAGAEVIAGGDQDGARAVLGIDDLHIHQAGAQAQELQVVADHRAQVLRGAGSNLSEPVGLHARFACITHANTFKSFTLFLLINKAAHAHGSDRPNRQPVPARLQWGCMAVALPWSSAP